MVLGRDFFLEMKVNTIQEVIAHLVRKLLESRYIKDCNLFIFRKLELENLGNFIYTKGRDWVLLIGEQYRFIIYSTNYSTGFVILHVVLFFELPPYMWGNILGI